MIQSLMQDVPLMNNMVHDRVEQLHANKLVTTRYAAGIERANYGEVLEQSARLAGALCELGVRRGDRIATLAWNSRHHLELYLAVPCMGAMLHTVNARLPGEAAGRL
jgi:acyl-CoA synthetase (AMP-forming)/AMP-acid ligase II